MSAFAWSPPLHILLIAIIVVDHIRSTSSSRRSRRLRRSSKIILPIKQPFVFSIIVFSKIILQKRNPIVKHKSTTFHTIHTTMLSVHISHWLMTVLIAVSYATGGYLNFFSKCFTILRILARAVSFFCRSITLALLNFCVSSHLHCSVRLTQVELSADTANTTGSSGNRAARCVRL